MRLVEIMSSPPASIAPDETVERALTQMRVENIHHLAVVDRGALVGVLSARDLQLATGGERVGERLTSPPITATPHTTVKEAANLLRGHGIGCLPIVERGRLVGMVTLSDLLELLGRGALRPSPRGERPTLKDRGPRKKRARVIGSSARAK